MTIAAREIERRILPQADLPQHMGVQTARAIDEMIRRSSTRARYVNQLPSTAEYATFCAYTLHSRRFLHNSGEGRHSPIRSSRWFFLVGNQLRWSLKTGTKYDRPKSKYVSWRVSACHCLPWSACPLPTFEHLLASLTYARLLSFTWRKGFPASVTKSFVCTSDVGLGARL